MSWIQRVNNQKNIILAVLFAIWGWAKEGILWGLTVFVMCLVAFSLIDWLKSPPGEGPLDRLIGIKKREDR